MSLPALIEAIYDLNVGTVGTGEDRHERPHKPALLVAALNRMDAGAPTHEVPWTHELRAEFRRVFDVVRARDDRRSPELPFLHLRSDGFWTPIRRDESGERPLETMPRVRDIGAVVARLDDLAARVLADSGARAGLREALISRYFPEVRNRLLGHAPLAEPAPSGYPASRGRSVAFRKKVMEVYDHQCVACGLRVRPASLPAGIIEAAHILPFAETQDDRPRNGLALCRNHHWAMDQHLIAPSPEGRWLSSPRLDARRSTAEEKLVELHGKRVLQPTDAAYAPRESALEWRVERLLSAG